MSYGSLELSAFSGRPLQLYRFLRSSRDQDFYWTYNSSERDLWFQGHTYTAMPISDEGMRFSGEAASSEFKVTLPATSQFCDDFRGGGAPPSNSIYLNVFRVHADSIVGLDTTAPYIEEGKLVWSGTVDGLTQISDVEAQITCSMLATSFKRGGLRYTWQKNCPHVLYEPHTCKANKEAFRADVTVNTVHGSIMTADGFSLFMDGWFVGGYIEYTLSSGFIETRMINRHIGASIRVLGPLNGMAVGDPVVAYAGCKRTVKDCQEKFGNYDNYGGFPHIPGRNPYDGNPVF